MGTKDIVKLEHIRKVFPGVVALDNVNLTLQVGKVHGLVGENGAGKSTLMKILSGTYSTYDGTIYYKGKETYFRSEKEALEKGISIVHQELNSIPELTIAENLFLGREPLKYKGMIDKKERLRKTQEVLEYLELDYNPNLKMKQLSIAQIQMIEILKAISRDSEIIIMDEPTSALTNIESEYLFRQIKSLKEKGITIVYISHRLEEVFQLCDDVTVLRDGKYIGTYSIDDVTQDKLVSMMVGRELSDIYPPIDKSYNETLLKVDNLNSKNIFENVSFELKKGEILGFSGMMGSGRSEIMRAIFGLDLYDSGQIFLEGKLLKNRSIHESIKAGIAMVSEDRSIYGFVGPLSIKDNIVIPNYDMFSKHKLLNHKKIRNEVLKIYKRLDIKAPTIDALTETLSGGNQQKVVLAKWLVRNVKVMILDEPTRGIDVGAKQEIYKLIVELAKQGMAIIFVSSDMREVIAMSHRLKIISDGRIIGELSREEAEQELIMKTIVEGGF